MSEQAEYTYDVFISYSHVDRAWVWGELLPRLEGAGLRVCIDTRDFGIGVPSLVNMERAVKDSRHTLIVMTPAWVESEWADFESLMVGVIDPAGRRGRLLPLMLRPCEPPLRIATLTYADFTKTHDHANQLGRLLGQIQGTSMILDQLYASAERAEADEDWQEVITVCQEIIGIAPFYRDVQRLLRKARCHSARQRAGAIWARYKTAIGMLAVLLLMAAGVPVLGKWIVGVGQPTPTPPTSHPISFLTPSSTSTWTQTSTATKTIAAPPTPPPSQPIIAGFLITHSDGFTSTIEARGIITVVTSQIIFLRPQLSTTPWPENVSCLWNARAQSRGRVSPTDNCTTSYQAPGNTGPDCITVAILKGGEHMDWSYTHVRVEPP